MQTASVNASGTPSQNFTVARVRQDLPNRSNIGAIVVNRQATGTLAGDRAYNRTFAVDGPPGARPGRDDYRIRGPDRDTRRRTPRHARLPPVGQLRGRAGPAGFGLQRGGTELQPGGRLLPAAGLPADGRLYLHLLSARELHGAPRAAPPRAAQHARELPDRATRDAVHPHRQPLGVGERTRDTTPG